MGMFSNSEILSEARAVLSQANKKLHEIEIHLMHMHNLQHTVIQEIVNLNLYRRYDSLG